MESRLLCIFSDSLFGPTGTYTPGQTPAPNIRLLMLPPPAGRSTNIDGGDRLVNPPGVWQEALCTLRRTEVRGRFKVGVEEPPSAPLRTGFDELRPALIPPNCRMDVRVPFVVSNLTSGGAD